MFSKLPRKGNVMNSKLFVYSAASMAALLLASVAQAADCGVGSERPISAPNAVTVPTPAPGRNIIIPAGTPVGSVIGFAPAGRKFLAAPITVQPTHTNGRALDGI